MKLGARQETWFEKKNEHHWKWNGTWNLKQGIQSLSRSQQRANSRRCNSTSAQFEISLRDSRLLASSKLYAKQAERVIHQTATFWAQRQVWRQPSLV